MTRVAGLDLAITAVGLAHSQPDGESCTHVLKPGSTGDLRIDDIANQVSASVRGSELVLIEDLPAHGKSAGITGMVHGAVRRNLIRATVAYATVAPATLKKYATGRGNADKTAMAVAAYRRGGIEFTDNNECDAWWLWVMARDWTANPVFDLPKVQTDVLTKVSPIRYGTRIINRRGTLHRPDLDPDDILEHRLGTDADDHGVV